MQSFYLIQYALHWKRVTFGQSGCTKIVKYVMECAGACKLT